MLKRGYIQVYTGDGKGKTTSAIGLAVRAAGAGLRVLFAQFIKTKQCSEHSALRLFAPAIEVRQYGMGCLLKRKPSARDYESATRGLKELNSIISEGIYDLIILDEANVALHHNIIRLEDLLYLMEKKHKRTELVITGRYANQAVIDKADLVTEMRNIKHYSQSGVKARKGIEK